jgi:hypothetical protein
MVANLESNPHEDYYTYPRIDIKKWLNQNENYKRWDSIRKIGISYNPQMGLGRGYGLDPTAN